MEAMSTERRQVSAGARCRWTTTAMALTLALATVLASSRAQAETLTIATLAPRKSAWGKVFNAWSKALTKKTGGQLKLSFYWNGAQGDDSTVVGKLRSGQIGR